MKVKVNLCDVLLLAVRGIENGKYGETMELLTDVMAQIESAEKAEKAGSKRITSLDAKNAIDTVRNFFDQKNAYAPDSIVWGNLSELEEILDQYHPVNKE